MADESSPLPTRLSAERADAHRRYNEALTAVDKAIQSLPDWPEAPPAAREGFAGLVRFESILVQFLQQITPLFDTKERALADAIEEVRNVAAVAQRTAMATKRELERAGAGGGAAGGASAGASGGTSGGKPLGLPVAQGEPKGSPPPAGDAPAGDAFKYVGFEDRFRGSEDEIRKRLTDFVPYFSTADNVLDVGCGRGEFLDLLKAKGVSARGLDLNPEMVEVCLARGLEATTGDALAYLNGLPDESLGGLLAVQVIEHLEPEYLQRFLQVAYFKLKPGARMVLETINPACWVAFFESYIRDLSHVRPIHPDTLQYLLHASGFSSVEVVFRAPIAEEARLQRVTPRPEHFGDQDVDAFTELVSAFNRNMDRLNSRMFTFQDYAAIATRP
ncbi:MAG: class I SAM-dependent methyltransferase [Vicinamibacterales bacterium]